MARQGVHLPVYGRLMRAEGVNGQVALDGGMVTISRSGMMARATVGKGEKRIPVKSIQAVQWKPASRLVRGYIQFTVSGGIESKARLGKQTTDAAKDENSVVFSRKQQGDFESIRNAVEQSIVDS